MIFIAWEKILQKKCLLPFSKSNNWHLCQRQRMKTHDEHRMPSAMHFYSFSVVQMTGWVLHHWVYVNPATQVSVYSPAYPPTAKSRAALWPWFSSVTRVHLNYCLCVMQGKNQHAMRSGCALWLIVKCCPGAHCQTPLNSLHSRKQSVAVTKGLVGTGPVMIDPQRISEDVSENWVSPESRIGQRLPSEPESGGSEKFGLRKNTFFLT